MDTEIRCLMKPEVGDEETEVQSLALKNAFMSRTKALAAWGGMTISLRNIASR
jgi:hypothetical protein